MSIFSHGLDPRIAKVFDEFRRLHGGSYTIKEDQFDRLVLTCDVTDPEEEELRQIGATQDVAVRKDGDDLDITVDDIAIKKQGTYNSDDLDRETLDNIQNASIRQVGERFRPAMADLFKGIALPTRIQDVKSLWKGHLDDSNPFESKIIVVDSTYETPKVILGLENLRKAHAAGKALVETIDIADVLVALEDQYKYATRSVLRDQAPWPSSFHPSRSFGGVSGYNKKSKKRNVKEDFAKQLDDVIEQREMTKPQISDTFETHLNEAFGSEIRIVEPEVLFVIPPKNPTGNIKEVEAENDVDL